ncbi:MAG: agmatine deiminase family protein [Alphaproteobacteria bacterium]|nr:agmatine deiminase family protein [Alphaproteobacteria bacterium]
MTTPALAGWHVPAEWERHSRCWMAWPCRTETWQAGGRAGTGGLEAACAAFAEVARTIARFEPVTMVCNPEDAIDVSLACGAGIQVLPQVISDSWLRDTGPSFLVNDFGGVAGVHWRFNAWGERYPDYWLDASIGHRILDHLGLTCYEAPLVLEGGAFCCDGEGTVMTTEACLLNANRNPGLGRGTAEALLKAYTGATKVIWLGEGYQDDETGGHVDEVACFVRSGVVLALSTDDPRDGNFRALQDNLDRLQKARDARGRELEVVPVRQPARREHTGGRLTLSYTNLYIANGGVILPGFEDSADQEAYRIVRRLFPTREVIQVPALDIVAGGGGIHCITQQQPAPFPIPYDPGI